MKLTTFVALVGAAQACHRWNEMKKHCPVAKMLFGAPAECKDLDESEKMDHWTFYRKLHQTWHQSFIKGWYHDARAQPVDEKCWGDWMDASKDNIMSVHENLLVKGDIWGVGHNEIKQAVSDLIDNFFGVIDNCSDYKFIYDQYSWCYLNVGECVFRDG